MVEVMVSSEGTKDESARCVVSEAVMLVYDSCCGLSGTMAVHKCWYNLEYIPKLSQDLEKFALPPSVAALLPSRTTVLASIGQPYRKAGTT